MVTVDRLSVLVTRRLPRRVLDALGAVADVELHDEDTDYPRASLLDRIVGKQALVSMLTDVVDETLLSRAPSLRVVANVAVGYNNIDVAAARAHGVIVTNTPDVLTNSTADLTWALILGITRRVAEGDRLIRAGGWHGWALEFMLGTELANKQIGIVGMGRIGRAVADRAVAFGMRVAFWQRPGAAARDVPSGWTPLALESLLATSDVVSIHVPLISETRHLISGAALGLMKPTAYLVNTARGPVVDELALADALAAGRLAGAALDVFEREPHVPEALRRLENVLLVPHLGSATRETRDAMADLAARNVVAVLTGCPALTPVS